MIYTSNKKYSFYISHNCGLPEACSMPKKAGKQQVMTSTHRNGISARNKGNKYWPTFTSKNINLPFHIPCYMLRHNMVAIITPPRHTQTH